MREFVVTLRGRQVTVRADRLVVGRGRRVLLVADRGQPPAEDVVAVFPAGEVLMAVAADHLVNDQPVVVHDGFDPSGADIPF